jgi:hypothetical protein
MDNKAIQRPVPIARGGIGGRAAPLGLRLPHPVTPNQDPA